MMGRTHMTTGALMWALAAPHLHLEPWQVAAGFVVAIPAALGPDLDSPGSKASRALWGPFHNGVGTWVGRLFGGHRGWLHTLWAVIIVGWLTWLGLQVGARYQPDLLLLAGWLPWALSTGWLAHIAGDCLTVSGVQILRPLPLVVRGPFTTNTWTELIFAALQWLALGWIAWTSAMGAIG